ncbi:permease for cytosine/purines, uracil, thiamine, allantoin-domain-containing protein [Tricladium varicosporioides]|nr:permease for cytosine/purines, uracil, thiamine, allantoin-domain-containing protein [Hymenoscyphus varicosporioides]
MLDVRSRANVLAESAKAKTRKEGWVTEKHISPFSEADIWTNKDSDITPLEQRTWTTWTMLGFWISDSLSAQGWEGAASIIAVGLTWREALYCLILGYAIDAIPMILNGVIGAELHVSFPVVARASFGFNFSKFAVVIRMITALFWHAIQTYTGSTAMTQCIRAIWPSFLNIPNHIPASVGITTQQMISHFLFWTLQFPMLLIPPYKLKWFFVFKSVVVIACALGMVIALAVQAGGAGNIWSQEVTVSGSTKTWLILSSMSSITGGWSTMGTNIPDFTRYLKETKPVYYQGLFIPLIGSALGILGIVGTSCSKVLYGSYIWDPLEIAAQWNSPGGRAAAFFVGFSWIIAQIGTNISANVISCSNDMTNLWPKYINIRRGTILTTVIAGWVMVPWKIIHSASSLLTFMGALAIFLAPIAAVMAADYWIVRRGAVDVPALYQSHGRYRYDAGFNWRAAAAMMVSLAPNLPGMAHAVNPNIKIGDLSHVYDINYLYGFFVAFFVYATLSLLFPAQATMVEKVIPGKVEYYVSEEKDGGDIEKSFKVDEKRHSLTGGGL